MFTHIPDHFSSKFAFDFSKLPTSHTDRTSSRLAVCSLLCGLGLLCLGTFELFSFIKAHGDEAQSFVSLEIFAIIVILIALFIIAHGLHSLIRYKKFYFDGKDFKIVYRPALGVKHDIVEPLSNYIGIRFRVLYKQVGLIGKNKYIIDLYHQDNSKIIPLYISTKNKNIRIIWENYAKLFKLPALSIGDRGLIQRDFKDINKTLKELNSIGKLPFIASGEMPNPKCITVNNNNHSTRISQVLAQWDIFSSMFVFIALSIMFLLIIGATYLTLIGNSIPVKYWISGIVTLVILSTFTAKLFSKSIIDIEKTELSIKDTLFGTITATYSAKIDEIENIELTYNPNLDKYNIAIIHKRGVILFKNKLNVDNLIWIRDFLIRKIIE